MSALPKSRSTPKIYLSDLDCPIKPKKKVYHPAVGKYKYITSEVKMGKTVSAFELFDQEEVNSLIEVSIESSERSASEE